MRAAITLATMLALCSSAEAGHHHHKTKHQDIARNYDDERSSVFGSWFRTFASIFSGGRTATGAHLSPATVACAHRSLPIGTRLLVSYRERSVVIPVRDRGPFIRGRGLDLTPAAAHLLGFGYGLGIARVHYRVL